MRRNRPAKIGLEASCQSHSSLEVDLSEQRFMISALVGLQALVLWFYHPNEPGYDAIYFALSLHFVAQGVRCLGLGRERDRAATIVGRIVYLLFVFCFLFSNLFDPLGGTVRPDQLAKLLGVVWPGLLLGIYGLSWDRETIYFSKPLSEKQKRHFNERRSFEIVDFRRGK